MIHPEATVEECLQEIGALERTIARLEAALKAARVVVEADGARATLAMIDDALAGMEN